VSPDAVWLGGRIDGGTLSSSFGSVDRWYTGQTTPTSRQTALLHTIEFERAWMLPTGTMTDALPERGDYVMEVVFQDLRSRRWHRRRYTGVQWSGATWRSDGLYRMSVGQRFNARAMTTDDGIAAFATDPTAFLGVIASYTSASLVAGGLLSGLYSCSENCRLGAVTVSATGGSGPAVLRLERDGAPVAGVSITVPAGAGNPVAASISNLFKDVARGTRLRWRIESAPGGTPVTGLNLLLSIQPGPMISAY
jgi:hypothetical protein